MGRVAGLSAAETRERLVQAAATVFAERGYDGARTSEIARRAGLSTGAIYSQYGTKAELLLEAIQSQAPADLDQLLSGAATGSGALLEAMEALAAELPFRPKTKVDLLIEAVVAGRRDQAVAQALSEVAAQRQAVLAGLVATSQAAGEIDPALPADAMARFLLTVLLGTLVVQGLELEPPDVDEWRTVVAHLVDSVRIDREG